MTSTGQVNCRFHPLSPREDNSLVIRSVDQKVATAASKYHRHQIRARNSDDTTTLNALVFHDDGTMVSKSRPAKRDERW